MTTLIAIERTVAMLIRLRELRHPAEHDPFGKTGTEASYRTRTAAAVTGHDRPDRRAGARPLRLLWQDVDADNLRLGEHPTQPANRGSMQNPILRIADTVLP